MDYAYVRKEDIKLNFVNGSAETEVIEGALPFIHSYRGVLQQGHSITPEVRSRVLSTYIITDMDGHELSLDSGSDTDVNGSTYASLPSSYDPRVTTNVNGKKTSGKRRFPARNPS